MAKISQSDLALSALAVEAERRRKAGGLLRYNYGDLMADTTPEERQQIVESYKKARRRDPKADRRFAIANDREDLRAILEKRGPQRKSQDTTGEEEN